MTMAARPDSERILQALDAATVSLERVQREKREPIAVVGLSCRFPGANSPEEFWRNLEDERDVVSEIPSTRWDLKDHYAPSPASPGKMYCRHGGFLDDVRGFDASLFRVSPREAASMDPQQRILLEVAWEALERAGMNPRILQGSLTSVHIGVTTHDYQELLLAASDAHPIDTYYVTGNAPNALAGRLSYVLGLCGPSMVVDTACSSSLVAVHLACQALRSRESDLGIAGGVNLVLSPKLQTALCQANMLSPSGRCRTFSAAADGYVRGEGCGILILKRLSDAQRDNDPILAQIRGSAVNQDGASGGFTVPHGPSQETVIRRTLEVSRVPPHDVDYLETHGTGTPLGDPIEINAAANVYGENRDPARPLLIGSVKTNVGHLEAAAGVAGLIKLVLAMQARVLPAHLHFTEPNPNIPWDRLPVKVTARTTPWGKAGKPMVAAISSFGASGTIAHAVVEEPPPSLPSFAAGEIANGREEVLVLSADSQEALRDLTQAYHDYLCDHTDLSILDLCYTAAACRAHLRYRRAVTGSSVSALRDKLARALEGESGSGIFLGHISTATASPSKQGAANLDPVTAGQQFVDGLTVVWEDLYPTRNPIALPTYPFQHVPYWVPLTETRSASNGLLYRCDWEPAEKRALVAASSPCHWVLISEVPDATKEVARRLEARHQPFATIQYGPRSVGRRTDRTDPSLDDALLKSLSNLPDRAPARILCFLEAETTHSAQVTTGTLGLNAAKSCQLLVDLVRSTSELSTTRDVRIWVVTRESQPFESADGISESRLAEPVAWGLGRTIATEHPDLFGGLIDIDCEPNAKTAEGLIDQVLLGTPQSSLRNGQTHVPRLHPIHEDAQQSETSPVIQSDATYLITGGLGALGKYLAHWLVDLGARNLILLSRRGERSDTGSDLDTIRSRGVRIWAPSTDVTRQEDVLTVMREIQRNWAPLLGIFHLAGVLDDRVVDRLDAESIACVLQPKVAGAWNLHLATADLPLDYFVLFSSLASWVGPAGQGSYAAANTFLDAVGRHRRATGLPSSTVSWGPWSGGGMWDSLDPVYRSQMRRSGIKPLSSDEALQALAVIMKNKISHAIVARIDWQEIFTTERPAFLRDWAGHLDPVGARPSKGQATDTDDMLSRDSLLVLDTTALARLTDFLAYLLAGILHLGSPGSIDVQRPLDEYGMDSLAATELRNRLASRLEVVLPVAQLIGGRSVLDLVDIIRDHLIAGGSADRSTQSADEDHETVEILI